MANFTFREDVRMVGGRRTYHYHNITITTLLAFTSKDTKGADAITAVHKSSSSSSSRKVTYISITNENKKNKEEGNFIVTLYLCSHEMQCSGYAHNDQYKREGGEKS